MVRADARAVRQGRKAERRRLQGGPCLEFQFRPAPQVRVDGMHELPTETLRRHLRDLDLGMREEETEQLTAGVSGAANDRGLHRARWLSAAVSTSTPRAKSSRSMASSGVWSSFESPGP